MQEGTAEAPLSAGSTSGALGQLPAMALDRMPVLSRPSPPPPPSCPARCPRFQHPGPSPGVLSGLRLLLQPDSGPLSGSPPVGEPSQLEPCSVREKHTLTEGGQQLAPSQPWPGSSDLLLYLGWHPPRMGPRCGVPACSSLALPLLLRCVTNFLPILGVCGPSCLERNPSDHRPAAPLLPASPPSETHKPKNPESCTHSGTLCLLHRRRQQGAFGSRPTC